MSVWPSFINTFTIFCTVSINVCPCSTPPITVVRVPQTCWRFQIGQIDQQTPKVKDDLRITTQPEAGGKLYGSH